ncbi:MAG: hypothetical protein Q8Q09_03830 [Deltaproteobacteria bacterium]|nr:hypothetical protein [Deltaproteobacteria bacterium]
MRTKSGLAALLAAAFACVSAGCSEGPRPLADASADVRMDSGIDARVDDGAAADGREGEDSATSPDATSVDALGREDSGDGGDSGPMCAMPVGAPPYADRMNNEEFTDPPTCAGCPQPFTDLAELDGPTLPANATSLTITGASRGATECHWYVSNASCGNTGGMIPVDVEGTGRFSTTVPVFCGANVVRLVCRNDRGTRVLVRRLQGTECSGRDLRVTLSWDEPGKDLELHLLRAPRALNSTTDDCTWFTCMSPTGLEWGSPGDTADNPRKDIDNTSSFGPENIFLDRAAPGTYHVVVEHWSLAGDPSAADVDIIVRERTVARLHRDNFVRQTVWYVGTITFPEGRFVAANTLTDCTASWMRTSRGCDLPLP